MHICVCECVCTQKGLSYLSRVIFLNKVVLTHISSLRLILHYAAIWRIRAYVRHTRTLAFLHEHITQKAHTQITPAGSFSYLSEEKRRSRARGVHVDAYKRYRNQSIICNNGFLKTTFHRPSPGSHVVSPHICQDTLCSMSRTSFRKGVYTSRVMMCSTIK